MPKNTLYVVRVGRQYVEKAPMKSITFAKLVDSMEKAKLYRTDRGAEKLATAFADRFPEKCHQPPSVHPVRLTIQASGYMDPYERNDDGSIKTDVCTPGQEHPPVFEA